MVNAKEFSGIERGYMSYIIAHSTQIESRDLNKWISVIGKADAINYKTLHNKELSDKLNTIFQNEDAIELFEDINGERSSIISANKSGDYDISSGVWFTMHSEKISIISDVEDLLLSAMDLRTRKIQEESLRFLIITFVVWLTSILLAILGYILSNEISKNIRRKKILKNANKGSIK